MKRPLLSLRKGHIFKMLNSTLFPSSWLIIYFDPRPSTRLFLVLYLAKVTVKVQINVFQQSNDPIFKKIIILEIFPISGYKNELTNVKR